MKRKITIPIKKEKPKLRGDWGGVKPYTRIERDKSKDPPRKQKYKDDPLEEI